MLPDWRLRLARELLQPRSPWMAIAISIFFVSVPVFFEAPLVRALPWLSLGLSAVWFWAGYRLRHHPIFGFWGELLLGFSWSWLAGSLYWGWFRWEPLLHLPIEAIGLPFALWGLGAGLVFGVGPGLGARGTGAIAAVRQWLRNRLGHGLGSGFSQGLGHGLGQNWANWPENQFIGTATAAHPFTAPPPAQNLPVAPEPDPLPLSGPSPTIATVGHCFYLGSLLGTAITDAYCYLIDVIPHWRRIMSAPPAQVPLIFQEAVAQVETSWGIGVALGCAMVLLVLAWVSGRSLHLGAWIFSGTLIGTLLVDCLFIGVATL